MTLRAHFEASGSWLFRRRGVLPLLLLPLFVVALNGWRHPTSLPRYGWWEPLCVAVSVLGFGLRVATVGFAGPGTSGRNRGAQRADSLNTAGMYSLVRHPLYLANYLMWLGAAAFPRAWWLPVMVSLVFALYYERIMFAEEEFLSRQFGPAFTAWAASTPAFLPLRLQWRPPDRPFSLRTVLRREYSGLLALVAIFASLDMARDFAVTSRIALDPAWGVALGTTAVVTAVLRALRHRTRLLSGD